MGFFIYFGAHPLPLEGVEALCATWRYWSRTKNLEPPLSTPGIFSSSSSGSFTGTTKLIKLIQADSEKQNKKLTRRNDRYPLKPRVSKSRAVVGCHGFMPLTWLYMDSGHFQMEKEPNTCVGEL